MLNPFEFKSYKTYLRKLLDQAENRGLMSRLSEAAGCQRPYLSKVLQSDSEVQLTPDHMYGICDYLGLSEAEGNFLKLLLEHERASSSKYRQSLEKRIAQAKSQHLNLKNQTGGKELLNTGADPMAFYYSYWLYAALHIAVSIPGMQTVAKLASKFSLPESMIESHLMALENAGLVKKNRDKWSWQSGDIHLENESYWILPHHMNWRNQAVQNVALRLPDDTHYSVVQSISAADFEVLRHKMIEWIRQFQKVSSPSAPEELVCFNLDFFKIVK
ncbi:DUF4423 domain-containing protein [Bdellovibrio sp. HCB337]|uniref:DUF4423 domain-containing protein n=1 Tax=Bdellovibrio sp. HCB337 TaxID=3394358 RepID=UPI0039A47005